MTPAEVRPLFPITSSRAYLFSGGLAPAATPVRTAHDRWTELWATDPADLYAHYHDEWELTRQRFAAIVGADPSEIAVIDHTSRGSNLMVQMIDAPTGSNVVVDEFTYPSSVYPWQLPAKDGVELRYVPARENRIQLEDLAAVIDNQTVAVSVSHVSPKTGFRHDLTAVAALAHERGALFLVDAAQSAGALEIDVTRMGIDFLSTCAMKWLLGAPGVGFLFVASQHVERLSPPQVGYASVVAPPGGPPPAPLTFKRGALRHEQGIPSLAGLAASRAGMDILLEVGMPAIEQHVLALAGACIDGLLSRDFDLYTRPEPQFRAGVIALPVHAGDAVVEFLRARSVDVWTDRARTVLRIDPHLFNNEDDVGRLLAGLDDFIQVRGRGELQG